MINLIHNIVKNGVKVEVKEKNRYDQYPVVVTDIVSGSITNGWSLTYYPKLTNDGQRLFDIRQAFSTLTIPNFKSLYNTIMTVDKRFLNGENVQTLRGNKYAVYEYGNPVSARFAAVQKETSTSITLTIMDEKSPFCMLSINFVVVNSKQQAGQRHLIGSEKQWDHSVDVFIERNAQFAPEARRYIDVFQEDGNTYPYIKAATQPGLNGVSQVDPNANFKWLRDISNEFQGLALAYEKVIIRHAMEVAYEAIKPTLAPQQSSPFQAPAQNVFGGTTFPAPTNQPVAAGSWPR